MGLSLRRMSVRNMLSFGPEEVEIDFLQLNLLVGVNGAGKSNVISLIELMAASPIDLEARINTRGGFRDWLFHGNDGRASTGEIDIHVSDSEHLLSHRLVFSELQGRPVIEFESVLRGNIGGGKSETVAFRHRNGAFVRSHGREITSNNIHVRDFENLSPVEASELGFQKLDMNPNEALSILSRFRDPINYPALSSLISFYGGIAAYRAMDVGVGSAARLAQPPGQPDTKLHTDLKNIPHVIAALKRDPASLESVLRLLRRVYPSVGSIDIDLVGSYVQGLVLERGGYRLSTVQMSDGTLRFLCLLLALWHPNTPSVVCLEEPETGLHPDAIGTLALALSEATDRTQILVTTQSDRLVSYFSEDPESVIVVERNEGRSKVHRLDRLKLKPWLEEFSLGELWTSGQIGGTQ
jgi:predicted ATPase